MENKFENEEFEKINMPDYYTPMPGSDLENNVVQSLKEKGLLISGKIKKIHNLKNIAAVVAAGIILFAAGWLLAKNQYKEGGPVTAGYQNDYMLLLFNTVDFKEDPSHVTEYGEWMKNISAQGIAAEGEELANREELFGSPANFAGNLPVSGYFIFKNISEPKANELAKNCPHVKHNGIVVLKKIIRH